MDDEELFRRQMVELEVVPLDPSQTALPADDEDDEGALFRAAMQDLAGPPDKDALAELRKSPPPRKLRIPKGAKDLRPEDSLDLHGKTTAEAVEALDRFVACAVAARMRTVEVVTGKGLHSEGGMGVLKRTVETWLRREGKRWVRAFSEAPRARGGSGAFILLLRRK